MKDSFIFDGEVLAEVYQDTAGDWGIFYNNNTYLLLGDVQLLAKWEIEMYEKYKHFLQGENEMRYKHITQVDGVCGGRKIIKGTRLEIEWIASMLSNGNPTIAETYKELQEDYGLSMDQINEVERYYFNV